MSDTENATQVELSPGMRVEVCTPENKFLFLGEIDEVKDGAIRVVESSGKELPPVVFNDPIKLKFHVGGQKIVLLYGQICGSTTRFWKLDRLMSRQLKEQREYFRQRVSVEAVVEHIALPGVPEEKESLSAPEACRVLDISMGGVLLQAKGKFQSGDRLRLTEVRIVPEEPEFSFICRVRRVTEGRNGNQYGCRFEGLSTREEDRLFRAIMTVQRRDIQARRDRGRV